MDTPLSGEENLKLKTGFTEWDLEEKQCIMGYFLAAPCALEWSSEIKDQEAVAQHVTWLFNQPSTADLVAPCHIPQYPVLGELNIPSTLHEIEKAVSSMNSHAVKGHLEYANEVFASLSVIFYCAVYSHSLVRILN